MSLPVETNLRRAVKNALAARAGWAVAEFCEAVGIKRTYFYALPPEIAPRRIKLGRRTIVTEAPSAWVARVAASGGGFVMRGQRRAFGGNPGHRTQRLLRELYWMPPEREPVGDGYGDSLAACPKPKKHSSDDSNFAAHDTSPQASEVQR